MYFAISNVGSIQPSINKHN